jgi:2-dehydropantoate 2-reductase
MKICVYGCGAIGSLLAARLAQSGAEVCVLARGAHLHAMQSDGLTLIADKESAPDPVRIGASASPADFGEQDVVFLTMKSHTVVAIANDIEPLLGANTVVVTTGNGLPWWYFYGITDNPSAPELTSVDPERKLWQAIGPERAIGCVVYPAARIESPGIVRHVFGDRFALGEPDGSSSTRVATVAKLLQSAGFDAPVQVDIRTEIWTKLIANAAYNPVSVVTGQTLGEMIDDPATHRLLLTIMEEVTGIAHALQCDVPLTPLELIDATRPFGAHKTSMLQDFEAGRSLELGPVVDAVIEMAGLQGIAVDNLAKVRLQVSGILGRATVNGVSG